MIKAHLARDPTGARGARGRATHDAAELSHSDVGIAPHLDAPASIDEDGAGR